LLLSIVTDTKKTEVIGLIFTHEITDKERATAQNDLQHHLIKCSALKALVDLKEWKMHGKDSTYT
jgi:hypothetical protein